MRWWTRAASPERGLVDHELNARVSRLRSELTQARSVAEGDAFGSALDQVASRLEDAAHLANRAADPGTEDRAAAKGKCLLAVHEVEAELCMLKPAELLYPTWVRLRRSLYRFDKGRRRAWKSDMKGRMSTHFDRWTPEELQTSRHRLRQLTLELHESALRYNRLNEDRARAVGEVLDRAMLLLWIFVASVMTCLTSSTYFVSDWAATLVSLVAGVSAGGMGAVFSRLAARRDEKVREKFGPILKSALMWHVSVGSGAALLVVAIALSERVFPLPEVRIQQVAFLVALGFGAGFSDRLMDVMLSRVIGTSSPQSLRRGE